MYVENGGYGLERTESNFNIHVCVMKMAEPPDTLLTESRPEFRDVYVDRSPRNIEP